MLGREIGFWSLILQYDIDIEKQRMENNLELELSLPHFASYRTKHSVIICMI